MALFLDGQTTHVGRGARLFAESRGILLFLFPRMSPTCCSP